jgi:hypothetical protein
MNPNIQIDEQLMTLTPCTPGWYAFFEYTDEEENGKTCFWGQPIEAWGLFQATYHDEEGTVYERMPVGMLVHHETGMLSADPLDAPNFLAVLFARALVNQADTDVVEDDVIQKFAPEVYRRLRAISEERKDAQMMGAPDYSQDEEGATETVN